MTANTLDVVVVGNAGVDTNIYIQDDLINLNVEANFTENIDCVGQAGGYTSRGFAQLDKKTAFIGYVGDDHNGRFVIDELRRDGVDTTGVFIDPMGTARSVNLIYKNGRRNNFYDGKGHMHLRPDLERCRAVLSRAQLAHFNIPNWARYLLPVARELGLTISCDIQDIVGGIDDYRREFVSYASIVFFSATNQTDPKSMIEYFLRGNPTQIVIAGMGAKGCAVGTAKEGIHFFPALARGGPVVDTNGAGDSLAVGFLSSFVLARYSLFDAIDRGQIAARHKCTLKASSSNLIRSTELECWFEQTHSQGQT